MTINGLVGGLASGLDTNRIIGQLIELERAPQVALAKRKERTQAALDAWGSISTKLADLRTAAAALNTAAGWNTRKATSSSDAATVAATTTASTGTLTFTVDQLAAAHAIRSNNTIAATSTVITTGSTITITNGTGTHTVNVGGGTLSEVVTAINSAGLGLSAAAVNTGSGYRLQVTSSSTGTSSSFSISAGVAATVGGMVVNQTGADAQLTIGSGSGAYAVTSSTNTFTGLVAGWTVTATKVSSSPVTVQVSEDVDALAGKVKALVDAANALRSELTTRSAYNPSTKQASSLNGDSTVRRISQQLADAVTKAFTLSPLGTASAAGITTDATGKWSFNSTTFKDAYASDPAGVRQLFTQTATITGSVTFVQAGARTGDGTYDVEVTAPAAPATALGLVGVFPNPSPPTLRVKIGDVEASYTPSPTDEIADVVGGLAAAVDAAGLAVEVTEDTGGVRITHQAAGSGRTFEVAWDGVTWESHAGTDAVGSIGGVAATGSGATLAVPLGEGGLGGLTVSVPVGAAGTIGSVTYAAGLAQRLVNISTLSVDPADGSVTTAKGGLERRIQDFERSIAAYERRLEVRERRLRVQFANLERSLGVFQSQSAWLAAQVSGLVVNQRPS